MQSSNGLVCCSASRHVTLEQRYIEPSQSQNLSPMAPIDGVSYTVVTG